MYIPLLGFANLLSGLMLLAPFLVRIGVSKTFVDDAMHKLNPHRKILALADLGIGAVALLNRLGIAHIYISSGGFPQIIVVFVVGLTLGHQAFKHVAAFANFYKKVEPYQEYVGGLGVLFGLHAIF